MDIANVAICVIADVFLTSWCWVHLFKQLIGHILKLMESPGSQTPILRMNLKKICDDHKIKKGYEAR